MPLLSLAVPAAGAALGALAGRALREALARMPRGAAAGPGTCEATLALAGVVLALGVVRADVPVRAVPLLATTAVLSVGAVAADLATRRLPDRLTLPGLGAGLVAALPLGLGALAAAGIGAGGLGVLFAAVRLAAPAGLGGGDVKLAAALGVPLGAAAAATAGAAEEVLLVLLAGLPVLAAALLLVAAALRRRRRLPFGPALVLAAWVELVIVV